MADSEWVAATILDRLVPSFQAVERHSVRIAASADQVWAALTQVTTGELRLFRLLMGVRGLPGRLVGSPRARFDVDEPLLGWAVRSGFAILGEEAGRELVVGGLTHVRHPQHGNYNGFADREIHGGPGTKLGVDQWARRAIVGRAVLVDVPRQLEREGRDYDPAGAYEVTVDDLEAALDAQGVAVEDGDVLLLHTGWLRRFLDADAEERGRLIAWETIHAPGLEPSERMVEWLWDHHLAAVASDTVGVEALVPDPGFFLHLALLPLLGMPLGEFWVLDALADDCADDGRYACLLVSVPFNLRGGVGSPPQAVAIK